VKYGDWLKFAVPVWGALLVLSAIAIIVAIAIGI